MAELAMTLKIPRSSLYARMKRREVLNMRYPDHIETTIARQARQYRCTYGVKRLRHVLRRTVGLKTSERKIRRILDKYQLRAVAKRPFKPRTTESDPHLRPSPNLLEKEGLPQNTNQQWVSDITYIKTREGWSYLCAFMDRYSRRILGWSLAKNMTSSLVEDAFRKSLKRRGFDKQPRLIVHSDRGSQYSSKSFRRMLREAGCLQSMSPRGDCYANAHAESLWSTIKTEGFTQVPHSHQQAKLVLFDYVETFYNSRRHHSSLGWQNPIDFELYSFSIFYFCPIFCHPPTSAQKVGPYVIERVLGHGANGIAYLAHDKTLDRKVVLKEHYPQELCTRDADSHCLIPLDEGTEYIFAESVNQFIREARLLASLEHPAIIKIHRVFSLSPTTCFYVMPLFLYSMFCVSEPKKHDELLEILITFSVIKGSA